MKMWQEILFKILKIEYPSGKEPLARSFLLPDGTFLGTKPHKYADSNYEPHYSIDNFIGNFVYDYLGKSYDKWRWDDEEDKTQKREKYNITDEDIQELYDNIDFEKIGKLEGCPLIEDLGCIRLNGDAEHYIVIPNRDVASINSTQYDQLTNWFIKFAPTNPIVDVEASDGWEYASYSTDDIDYIVERIKRYYRFGNLYESYEPPYNAEQIKKNYGDELYNKLIKDPAHKWRMETGIELIHKEPTKQEFERIWNNWNLMSDEQKKKSDEKSIELFGIDNKTNYQKLLPLYEKIVKKEPITLYHLSEKKLEDTLTPRIPESDYEDQKTARICFSKSIQGCLIGINEDKDIKEKEFFVYTLITNDYYEPTPEEVADVNVTDEVWYLKDYEPNFAYKIKVIDKEGTKKEIINGSEFEVPIWKYEKLSSLDEGYKSNNFEPFTAGYILEDGSFFYVDEYHGDDTEHRGLLLPEFSNTHPEDDTCVRVYKLPNDNQFKKLEQIIDYYLDNENYCKVEIWDKPNHQYKFYKIYSLFEGACDDVSFDEEIGNWTGYKLVQIIKNQFMNKENIKEELYYHGSPNPNITQFEVAVDDRPSSFFSKSKQYASQYIYDWDTDEPTGCIYVVDIDMKNPLDINSPEGQELKKLLNPKTDVAATDLMYQYLKQHDNSFKGIKYDGLISREELSPKHLDQFGSEADKCYIPLDSNQITIKKKIFPLHEDTKAELIAKAKSADSYRNAKKGNRWTRQSECSLKNTKDDFNSVDMDTLFKKDILTFKVKVAGETNNYVVLITFPTILDSIKKQVRLNKGQLEEKCIKTALTQAIGNREVKVSCNCPDFKYRLAYYATKNGTNSGKAETRASKITNADDTKGATCKHINLVLNDLGWIMQLSTVIYNYIEYSKTKLKYNYDHFIAPRILEEPKKEVRDKEETKKED